MNIGTFSNITRGLILNKHTAFKEQSHVPIRHDCGGQGRSLLSYFDTIINCGGSAGEYKAQQSPCDFILPRAVLTHINWLGWA